MIILGLNAYHGDAAACLLRDGEVVAAAEEERFTRIKHWAGFPAQAIRYCLSEAGLSLKDIDAVATNSDPRANLGQRIGYALRRRPSPLLLLDRLNNHRRRLSVEAELSRVYPGESFRGAVRRVEHHRAHLASAFFASPFERAACVSIDGFGDFASAAWGVGDASSLTVDGKVLFPHSLGVFYQAITQYLGFSDYGDEYKVMGLAPYGAPVLLPQMRQIVRLNADRFELDLSFFRHHREKIDYDWSGGAPHVGALFAHRLVDLLGPARGADDPLDQRFLDIARSAQEMYEEGFFHILDKVNARTGETRLALAGGCAMNSVANGKIARRSAFRDVYVAASAGDSGGAIGAALDVWTRASGRRCTPMTSAYLGPAFEPGEIGEAISQRSVQLAGCALTELPEDALCARIAASLAAGDVVGWFQGRMEWGPRALGNRSILCDPRRDDMKDILNRKIKRRESFRPFAPSILAEEVGAWFEESADVPFMTQVFQIREEQRARLPAVTHVDGSGRLQTVSGRDNELYHRLISTFRDLTGVPILLNTSFNENEPIVCTPLQALDCFLRTNMDVLALGAVVISRPPHQLREAATPASIAATERI